ncbi:MAG: enoyl-CoA hydratase-related protein [bacterium]
MEDKGFTVSFDAATGVATLTMAMPGKVNKINADFGNGFIAAFAEIQAMPGLKGIIIASGHKDFCAGADIDFIYGQRDADALYAMVNELHAGFRALETCASRSWRCSPAPPSVAATRSPWHATAIAVDHPRRSSSACPR